jgi:DNA-binding MarR family transcriptional regulator
MMFPKVNQATEDNFDRRIEAVRSFNRFYTKQIGALREGLLESRFSLAEVRVLYKLARRDSPTATERAGELNLDAGYLSRILRSFEERGLIGGTPSGIDGRQSHLFLTKKGQKEFAPLNPNASATTSLVRHGN